MTRLLLLLVFVSAIVTRASAQDCGQYCARFDNAEITVQRAGIALSGGNPILGASSTMGIRLGALPKLTVAARLTGARLEITDENTSDANDELSSIAHSINLDAAVGIFSGFSLLPTVGGFGSIDLIASYGKLSLSDDDDFRDDPASWGAGVRIGILRESFTAPGISVSGMYRSIGDYRHVVGEPQVNLGSTMAFTNNRALSLRATVGKRILMLGATAGIGYDKYDTDANLFLTDIVSGSGRISSELDASATTIFANLSWTMLILHIVGEGGVQRGDGESSIFGSLAIRLAF